MVLSGLAFVTVVVATMFFSYWHGRGDGPDLKKAWYETKGVLIAGEALVGALAGFAMTFNPLGLLGALISPYYWFLWRTSKQARAELDYMGRLAWGKLIKVLQGYYLPVGINCAVIAALGTYIGIVTGAWLNMALIIPCIGSVAAPYYLAKRYRNDPGESARENRAMVEIGNGFCGGVNVASALLLFAQTVNLMR